MLQTDDLEQYSPDLFGHGRLALGANRDLIRGWGAEAARLAAADEVVDRLAATDHLAP